MEAKDRPSSTRFFAIRRRFYGTLLLFVTLIGLPIVGVPGLRERLSQRSMAFRSAFSNEIIPVKVAVGENQQPFPVEFERPEPLSPKALQLPAAGGILVAEFPSNAPPRIFTIPKPAQPPEEALSVASAEDPPEGAEDEPRYQKGEMEQAAYDLLLGSNPTAAKMARGGDSSFVFKSWDAASRGDDIYWVRLKFKSEATAEVEYIWQVRLQSKSVTPLNHNAREIF